MKHRKPRYVLRGMEVSVPPSQPLPPLPPKRRPGALRTPVCRWTEFERPRNSAPDLPGPSQRWQTDRIPSQPASERRPSSEGSGGRASFESGVLPALQRPLLERAQAPPVLPLRSADRPRPVTARKLADLTGHDLAFPDDVREQTVTLPPAEVASSRYSADGHPLSEPSRTLSIIEAETPRREVPWTPASPVPPQLQRQHQQQRPSLQLDQGWPRSSSLSLHHFETIPARRSNHNEHSVDGARDLYHATATQIAVLTKGTGADTPRETLSFAAKVMQTGRKGVPARVQTGEAGWVGGARTTCPPRSGGSWFDMEEDKPGAKERCSDAFSKVLKRGGGLCSPVWAKQGEGRLGDRSGSPEPAIPMRARRASGPDTPRPLLSTDSGSGPGSPRLLRKINGQWNELLAQAKRTVSEAGVGMSREERRRQELRAKIRVLPEGARP